MCDQLLGSIHLVFLDTIHSGHAVLAVFHLGRLVSIEYFQKISVLRHIQSSNCFDWSRFLCLGSDGRDIRCKVRQSSHPWITLFFCFRNHNNAIKLKSKRFLKAYNKHIKIFSHHYLAIRFSAQCLTYIYYFEHWFKINIHNMMLQMLMDKLLIIYFTALAHVSEYNLW